MDFLPTQELMGYRASRGAFHTPRHRALSQDIGTHGIKEPVVIWHDDTHCLLFDGESRVRAAGEHGIRKIPVTLVRMPNLHRQRIRHRHGPELAKLIESLHSDSN